MAKPHEQARTVLFAFLEIKKAIEDFDRGESNLFDALDRIKAVVQAAGDAERDAA
jgi:hypothetical protein